jgi:hypothetical protein
VTESRTAAVEHRDSPFLGLDYYDERFGDWFFGREAERGQIITNLQAAPLTLLHAESGVGKSSLLRAGVAWRLRALARDHPDARDVPVVFSAWKADPVSGLIAAIAEAIEPFVNGRPPPSLGERLAEATATASEAVGGSLVVILDQFEEYFLYTTSESPPERFADELARAITADAPAASFLIAIREDAYAALGDLFKSRNVNVYDNFLSVDYLDVLTARAMIYGSIDVYNNQSGVERVSIDPAGRDRRIRPPRHGSGRQDRRRDPAPRASHRSWRGQDRQRHEDARRRPDRQIGAGCSRRGPGALPTV